ncbi:serine/threonine-protein kinase 17B isoform X3 [Erpetoichthys calabaricus]|uniref:non-specific serine/threonine protein kinase n=2 Tax=Erpetoichthys calabaricus TaxID=27687 RepID=A0A8C4T5D5_ERPCA|nr:serine/threonine-protein kinase 17B isoform X1 [Erpetoichthys calabaricus]XP_051786174.1 serine/threonine-protein kinase 17B isoform X2 [Erpetoichthys calabaricus]XP_051786175.1 serine/threonine-protein kinase 17B isoform X3 [Erpetoichthys calabaricus]
MLRKRADSKAAALGLLTDIQTCIRTDSLESQYELTANELGRGKFAVVKRCIEKLTGKDYAAKFLKKRRRGRDCRAEIIHEVAILEMARWNTRIISLHEVYETDHEIILVLEYAAGGEIFDFCASEETLTEREITRVLWQTLEGVQFLHHNNIVHLDLKPQNILLTSHNPLGDIKIVDFGLSRKVGNSSELREIMGTPEYVAPEILNYEPITTATDMWSVGVIAYMLVTGESPFCGDDKQETYLNVSQANVDYSKEAFEEVSELAVDFIRKLLVKSPEDRLSAADCLSHPWLWQTPETSESDSCLSPPRRTPGKWSWEDKENMMEDGASSCKRFCFDSLLSGESIL